MLIQIGLGILILIIMAAANSLAEWLRKRIW